MRSALVYRQVNVELDRRYEVGKLLYYKALVREE